MTPRVIALSVLPYCDVCEEPVPAVTKSRHHGDDVMLCADCLIGELEVMADIEGATCPPDCPNTDQP